MVGSVWLEISVWDKFFEAFGVKAFYFFTGLAKTKNALTTLIYFCPEAWLVNAWRSILDKLNVFLHNLHFALVLSGTDTNHWTKSGSVNQSEEKCLIILFCTMHRKIIIKIYKNYYCIWNTQPEWVISNNSHWLKACKQKNSAITVLYKVNSEQCHLKYIVARK